MAAHPSLEAVLGVRDGADRYRLVLLHHGQRSAQVHEQRRQILHRGQRLSVIPALSLHVAQFVSEFLAGRSDNEPGLAHADERAQTPRHDIDHGAGSVHPWRLVRRLRSDTRRRHAHNRHDPHGQLISQRHGQRAGSKSELRGHAYGPW